MELLVVVAIAFTVFALSSARWGPGTHILFADQILEQMEDRLSREQVQLLRHHKDDFLYGNIAADIINFKKYGGMKNHCHNWNMHERIEQRIESEHEYAFLYGYLCHLAADVIAHNNFVPFQIVYGLPPVVLGHTYWEARADDLVGESHWVTLDHLRTSPELHESDEIINASVAKKALSLSSNKWIFNNILLARSKKSWRRVMERMRRQKPRGEIQLDFHDPCLMACMENLWQVFDEHGLAELKRWDPNGLGALRHSRLLRRQLIREHGSRAEGAEAARAQAHQDYRLREDPPEFHEEE